MILLAAWFGLLGALIAAVSDFAYRRLAIAAAVVLALVITHEIVFDVVAQKVAGHLAMPICWAWAAAFAAAVFAVWNGRRRLATASVTCFVALSLAGNPWLGIELMRSLQDDLPVVDWRQTPPFDAVLVLGGGTAPGPHAGHPQLSASGDRVMLGARMWHAGKVRWLVSSGRALPGLGTRSLAKDTHQIWNEVAIPSEVMVALSSPHNTSGELKAFAALAKERKWKRLGVISSAYHLPRALKHAEHHDLKVVPLAAQWVLPPKFSALNLVVQRGGVWMVQTACWEYLGRWVGR